MGLHNQVSVMTEFHCKWGNVQRFKASSLLVFIQGAAAP